MKANKSNKRSKRKPTKGTETPSGTAAAQLIRSRAPLIGKLTGPTDSSAFYLFFSFDLAGSTQFKTLKPNIWPLAVQKFYELIQDSREKRLEKAHFWKYVGDEVLLYKKVTRVEDVYTCIQDAYSVLDDTINRLHDTFPDTRNSLSVKATVWCARTRYIAPQEIATGMVDFEKALDGTDRNLVLYPDPETGVPDFLGPDIDIGFRISKYALRHRLALSADLAYLLWKLRSNVPKVGKTHGQNIEELIRIVSFQRLQGVWENRGYPIVWFEPSWEHFSESFTYDEHLGSEFVREVLDGKDRRKLADLEKVYQDRNQLEAVERFCEQIVALDDVPEEPPRVFAASNYAELHCVAVCVDEEGRVLAAQRSKRKTRFKGFWEFGCGQLNFNETFEDCLKRAYREDFGADLEFGPDGRAKPFKTFLIHDHSNGRIIPGLIFVARVTNVEDVAVRRPDSHDAIRWIQPSGSSLLGSHYVEGFTDTAEQAVSLANSIWGVDPSVTSPSKAVKLDSVRETTKPKSAGKHKKRPRGQNG